MPSNLCKILIFVLFILFSNVFWAQKADSVFLYKTDTVYIYDTVKVYQNVKKIVYVEGPPESYWSVGFQLSQELHSQLEKSVENYYGTANAIGINVQKCHKRLVLESGFGLSLARRNVSSNFSNMQLSSYDTLVADINGKWWAQNIDGEEYVYYQDSIQVSVSDTVFTDTSVSHGNKRLFLSVPLLAGYKLKNGFWTFELKTGAICNYLVYSDSENILFDHKRRPVPEPSNISKFQVYAAAQFNMKYMYNLSTLLNFSFQYAHPLTSFEVGEGISSISYNSFAVHLGIAHIIE